MFLSLQSLSLVLFFSSQVWRGVKKEEGSNNTQKGEKRFERKGDISRTKIMGCIVMLVGKRMRGVAGEVISSPPSRLHHFDNRYRKSPPNT
jgi:hypothetical protein